MKKFQVIFIVLAVVIMLHSSPPNTPPVPGINFPDFNSTAGINFVEDAAHHINVLRLTPSHGYRFGAAWYETKQHVGNGFTTTFEFQITDLDNEKIAGADGIAFVIQNHSACAIGQKGGGIGYGEIEKTKNGGIPNSLAVEFDTHHNDDYPYNDPDDNHIAIHSLGTDPNSSFADGCRGFVRLFDSPYMSDEDIHKVKIEYQPGIMTVFIDDMICPVLTVAVNLSTLLSLDNGKAFVGFTSATGTRYENHDIVNWFFNGEPSNHPPVANAGDDISITSDLISSTTIMGSASDEDPGDTLHYRWKKGGTILLDWSVVNGGNCPLDLSTISIGIGIHTLALEVTDGQAESSDQMILTIENSAPQVNPTGGGVYEVNTDVILGGTVSDNDGDTLTYRWLEGIDVLFSGTIDTIVGGTPVTTLPDSIVSTFTVGIHTLVLEVDDGYNDPVEGQITIEIKDTTIPDLEPVANKTCLWPPNHKMVTIRIEAHANDNSGLPVTLSVQVSSNEPIYGLGNGDRTPDWIGPQIDQENGIIKLRLRAERSGKGNGRVYTIAITATDEANNSSTANVEIIVPHHGGCK